MINPTIDQRLALRARPTSRVVMKQNWRELLFLHWRMNPVEIQSLLPKGLTVDTYDGCAWVGIVPFFMCDVHPVWAPSLPGLSNFLELNIRTYVFDKNGIPGVWFFSLDANQPIAVYIAQKIFKLPYYKARMRARATPATVDFWSQRGDLPVDHFVYQPLRQERLAHIESLDFFLVERYLLYTFKKNRLYTGRVHHEPYRLREVKVLEYSTQLLRLAGITNSFDIFDHACYVSHVDVDIFGLAPSID
jgi:uncharacterized protein